MLKKFRETIEKYNLLKKGDRVLVAISGGADSTALLKALLLIAPEYGLEVVAAHLNHGWRGAESSRDADHISRVCHNLNVELIMKATEPPLGSGREKFSESQARNDRYNFLRDTARQVHATKIALGHNFHDQAETVLLNLIRGAGTEGLRGMLPFREGIYIRPLLNVKRDEIYRFLKKEGLTFVMDSSNDEESYLRNRIRRRLLPLLEDDYNPRVQEHLNQLAHISRLEDEYLSDRTEEFLYNHLEASEEGLRIKTSSLMGQHKAIIGRVVKIILQRVFPRGKEVNFKHVEMAQDFLEKNRANSKLTIARGATVSIDGDYFRFCAAERTSDDIKQVGFYYPVTIPGRVVLQETAQTWIFDLIDKRASYDQLGCGGIMMDYDRLSLPLIIRNRRQGDWIQPLGMKGRKTIKKLFIDRKVPRLHRGLVPLLVDAESVVFVAGGQIGERVRVGDETSRILKIEIV